MTTANAITLEAIRMSVDTNEVSRKRLWTGRVLSGLSAAFFILDGAMKLAKPAVVVEATKQLGYPESTIVGIGVVLLVCTLQLTANHKVATPAQWQQGDKVIIAVSINAAR